MHTRIITAEVDLFVSKSDKGIPKWLHNVKVGGGEDYVIVFNVILEDRQTEREHLNMNSM